LKQSLREAAAMSSAAPDQSTNTENKTKPSSDPLGYSAYADALWARIEAALNKDEGKAEGLGDDPLVVGIFGEWGAGKSHLLGMVLKKAQDLAKQRVAYRNQDAGFGLTVPVFFQPWKYEHETHLLVPLMLHILAALKDYAGQSQTTGESIRQAAEKAGDQLVKAMPMVVQLFEKAWVGTKAALTVADPTMATMGLALAKGLAAYVTKPQASKRRAATELTHSEDGRFYYQLHEIFKHITRPGKHPSVLPDLKIDAEVHINFGIFIDDLDRCLPEKAVQSLELIKTVFNVESFAFVLALDDEVIERGIGHRYKDYELQDKKPKMPITGFEYLEKIVHLPFRLPALTQHDALAFIEQHENQLLTLLKCKKNSYQPEAWFTAREVPAEQVRKLDSDGPLAELRGRKQGQEQKIKNQVGATAQAVEANYVVERSEEQEAQVLMSRETRRSSEAERYEALPTGATVSLNLAHFLIQSFDAYVPRKLVRVVELFHQVLAVAHQRHLDQQAQIQANQKPPVSGGLAEAAQARNVPAHLGGLIDPRMVLAFVLLQLFQPELYRTLKRTA
jgi:KAP family P-loop domain